MGYWGVKILDNDDAADIRGTYPLLLARGHTHHEVIEQLLKDIQPENNSREEIIFWLVIALSAWTYGNLDAKLLYTSRTGGIFRKTIDGYDMILKVLNYDEVLQRELDPEDLMVEIQNEGNIYELLVS